MNDQWKASCTLRIAFGLVGVLAGYGSPALAAKPSSAAFTVAIDATDPQDKQVVVSPDEGDAWLQAVANPGEDDNKIIWRSKDSFSIKFVQIDDQSKKPSKKFGDEGDDWNHAVPDGDGYKYRLRLRNGSSSKQKSIQGAKYLVKSPAGCDDTKPGPSCVVLDPVIIVRY